MDKKFLVAILTAFLCGSIKNTVNQLEPFQGRLAKETDNHKPYVKSKPYYLTQYGYIGDDDNTNTNINNKGKLHGISV